MAMNLQEKTRKSILGKLINILEIIRITEEFILLQPAGR